MFVRDLYETWRSSHRTAVRKRWKSIVWAYAMTWTVGLLVVIPFFLAYVLLGRLRVRGYRKLVLALVRGKVIIASNHPAVLESLFISILCCPFFLCAASLFWPYAMPDAKTFLPKRHWWVYRWIRCITVDRGDKEHVVLGTKTAVRHLRNGYTLVIHPEGGRTFKLPQGERYHFHHDRRLRPLKDGVASLALMGGTEVGILPLWVQFHGPTIERPESTWSLLKRGLVIYVGDLYSPEQESTGASRTALKVAITQDLARRILRAGLESDTTLT